jgi:hypothetical protein
MNRKAEYIMPDRLLILAAMNVALAVLVLLPLALRLSREEHLRGYLPALPLTTSSH